MPLWTAGRRLYHNANRDALHDEDHPDARFLFAAPGQQVDAAHVKAAGMDQETFESDAPAKSSKKSAAKSENKAVSPDENKARSRSQTDDAAEDADSQTSGTDTD